MKPYIEAIAGSFIELPQVLISLAIAEKLVSKKDFKKLSNLVAMLSDRPADGKKVIVRTRIYDDGHSEMGLEVFGRYESYGDFRSLFLVSRLNKGNIHEAAIIAEAKKFLIGKFIKVKSVNLGISPSR